MSVSLTPVELMSIRIIAYLWGVNYGRLWLLYVCDEIDGRYARKRLTILQADMVQEGGENISQS